MSTTSAAFGLMRFASISICLESIAAAACAPTLNYLQRLVRCKRSRTLELHRVSCRFDKPVQISGDISTGNTPDVSADMNQGLNLTDSSADDDDYEILPDSDTTEEEADIERWITSLVVSQLPTGLCYEERMCYHSEVSASTGEEVTWPCLLLSCASQFSAALPMELGRWRPDVVRSQLWCIDSPASQAHSDG